MFNWIYGGAVTPPVTEWECTIKLQNCSNELQRVQNMCARLICNESKYCHITPLLVNLHWLPVKFRIEFQILLIVFKIFKGLASSYLSFLITSKPVCKHNLTSSSDSTLLSYLNVKPKATLSERAFLFAASKLWTAVPRFFLCTLRSIYRKRKFLPNSSFSLICIYIYLPLTKNFTFYCC